jgi:hypothetical protein
MGNKIKLRLFKKSGSLTDENNFKTLIFQELTEALEMAEYFYSRYFYQSQIVDNNGKIYAEFEN